MSKYDHSDRLSLLRLTEELEADQGISEKFDPEREIDTRFAEAALKILEAEDPDSTYTSASAVSGVLNHWIINSDLPVYRDGVLITDPIGVFSEPHKLYEDSGLILPRGYEPKLRDIGRDMDYFDERIFIRKADFKALCRSLPITSHALSYAAAMAVASSLFCPAHRASRPFANQLFSRLCFSFNSAR